MTAQVVDEFLVLEKYRVMVLDQDIPGGRWAHSRLTEKSLILSEFMFRRKRTRFR